ncbi:transmembrane protein 184C [Trypanosoma theileri]|uniref:Transmembrane protein 184C n=1 Tax=Trypanosoma theileri TaxID=67003 RepID=A0A1X0NUV4_9TRYP|nr:transmembrane protein 184C [Trypanosoma theileri]ORC88487.1 transmembrane protein 184C [Trypanosoma theileri]
MVEHEVNGTDDGSSVPIMSLDMTWTLNPSVTYAAGVFVVIACILSFADTREHLARFDYPQMQIIIIRIIAMIPIYGIFSLLSLVLVNMRFFLETIRDTYESFVLYMFFILLLKYCGGEGQLLRSLKAKRYKGVHLFPVCFLPMYPLDTAFYLRCKRWVLQCALIKPLCSFLAMVLHPIGVYNEGDFSLNNAYTYVAIIINFSLTMSLYYLVLFEVELEKELHYAKPFLKFLCIKTIIFFSFWQSVMVSLLVKANLLYTGKTEHEQERVAAAIQDLLMCFEILPVALMHRAAFGRKKLDEEMAAVPMYIKDESNRNIRSNIDAALSINDVIEDTLATIFYRRGKLVDQENTEYDNPDDMDQTNSNKAKGNAISASPTPGSAVGGGFGEMDEAMVVYGRDPTVGELVHHAIATDYGVRADGLLHFDDDSDREERNRDMNFTDTDVIMRRTRHEEASEAVKVDTELLQSHQTQMQTNTPQIYCVVCGRFDREMVRRKNGYKCKECIGVKSKALLRTYQRETLQPSDEGSLGPPKSK